MALGTIRPAAGSTRPRKRRGKGAATGIGGTSGRGHKGHKARSGGKIPAWFEGGQMPVQRRSPKRGFKPLDHTQHNVLKLAHLSGVAAGTVVDRAWLKANRVVRRPGPVKLLASGTLSAAITVKVDAASAAAVKAVEAAGGKVEIVRSEG